MNSYFSYGAHCASKEERAIYQKLNAQMNTLDDERVDKTMESIGAYIWADSTERKRAYSKVYRIAKRFGVRVNDLVTWYCMD